MTRLDSSTAPRDFCSRSRCCFNRMTGLPSCQFSFFSARGMATRNTVGINGCRSAPGRRSSLQSIFPWHLRVVSITPAVVLGNTTAGCGKSRSRHKLERGGSSSAVRFYARSSLTRTGPMDCGDLSAAFHSRIGPMGSLSECRQKRGGRGTANGNSRNNKLGIDFDCWRARTCRELHASSRDRDHIIFYVGLPHLFERHSGSASEIDLRSQLCAGHADSVCILFCLFLVFYSLVEGRQCNRLSEGHGGGIALHGCGCISVCAGGFFRFVPAVFGGIDRTCNWHHRLAGSCQPLRGRARKTGNCLEPPRPDAGI